ncbi:hypothetical protein IAI10_19420 [Clostridium sp. 19966]|uniref:hypothetical protein n=1 Tax=Clostridium sp. 19966 TaxID=2768166 RepID=UPI0028E0583C|nr:hypothetical protein [Clostridium sp. 19966]MDT8718828.1 hypothetical protein [Clostridium sp. 19966]
MSFLRLDFIQENDITDSTYEVDATVVVVEWGIVINSGSSSDIIFVDTGGVSGFEYDGIGEG